MNKKINCSMLLVMFAIMLFSCISTAYAQNARIFVEVRVNSGQGYGAAYEAAMSFIDAVDLKGLELLEPPDTGFIDPQILKKFLPPPLPLKGTNYLEVEGPAITPEGYAYVNYYRGEEIPWDEIEISIKDGGISGTSNMRNMHLSSTYREHTDSTTIKGYDATVFRIPFTGDYYIIEIAIVIPVQGEIINWINVSVAALEGTRKGVEIWSASARFTQGSINASKLIILPGSLEGPSFEEIIISEIMILDVPMQIAQAFAAPVWSGWKRWSETFSISSFPAFPSFVAFPGPQAPSTSALPIPLSAATFNRDLLKAENLKTQILSRLGKWKEDPDAQKAVERFTEWFDDSFTSAIAKSQISNLYGQGPVPTFAPPEVPSGPVVGGSIIPSPGSFSNLQF